MKTVNKLVIYFEVALLAILVVSFIVLLLQPFHPIRKVFFSLGIIVSLIVVYIVRAYIMWTEKPEDERSLSYSYKSSWLAYLTGSLFLLIGIFLEAYEGDIDEWLLVSLAAMFLAKFSSMIYLERFK